MSANVKKALKLKKDYINQFVSISSFVRLTKPVHRDSPEVREILEFGLLLRHIDFLGFGVPLTTRGKHKGKPDPIRYINKIIDWWGYKLVLVRCEENKRVRTNLYQVVEFEQSDLKPS